jgi:hypothetical protein
MRQYRAIEVQYHHIEDYLQGVKATAKAVAHSNVAAAFFRYAVALYDWDAAWGTNKSPAKGSVFGA